MLERIAKNPLGWLIGGIVALIFIASYMKTILQVGAIVAVMIVLVYLGRLALKRKSGDSGKFCKNCPHPTHGHQACGMCRCATS